MLITRKLPLIIFLLVSLLGCQTSSHVYTVLGHRYPEYLKCEDCTNKENVKIASDRIMNNFLEKSLENYDIFYFEDENTFVLEYQLKYVSARKPKYKGGILLDGWSDAVIKISKQDCKIIDIKRF